MTRMPDRDTALLHRIRATERMRRYRAMKAEQEKNHDGESTGTETGQRTRSKGTPESRGESNGS